MKELIAFLGTISLVFLVALLFAYPEMLIINAVFSPTFLIFMFGGAISFWKTVGLGYIATFLFRAAQTK